MALGSNRSVRAMNGRLGPSKFTDDTVDVETGVVGVGSIQTFGIDARAMDPRATARLRTRYAVRVQELEGQVNKLKAENATLRAQLGT